MGLMLSMYNDFDGNEPIDLSGHLSGLLKWPTFGTLSVRAASSRRKMRCANSNLNSTKIVQFVRDFSIAIHL
jgi:hypothetical protein